MWHGDLAPGRLVVGIGPRLATAQLSSQGRFGDVKVGPLMDGIVGTVLVEGRRAYASLIDRGVAVFELQEDGPPQYRGATRLVGELGPMASSGDWLYVASGSYGLRVIDVRDPASPSEVRMGDGSAGSLGLGNVRSVARSGDYLVVACGGSAARPNPGVRVLDIQDPGSPREVADLPTPAEAYSLAVDRDWVYVVHAGPEDSDRQALWVVDLSEPTAPAMAAEVLLTDLIWDIAVDAGRLYIAADDFGVITYDVQEPEVPRLLGLIDAGMAHRLRANGDVLLVFTAGGPVQAYDTSSPREPVLVGLLDAGGPASDVAHDRDALAVAEWSHWPGGALRVVDVAEVGSPRLVATKFLTQWQEAVAMHDRHVLVGGYDQVLRVFELRGDVSAPELVLAGRLNSNMSIRDIELRDDLLFAATARGGSGALWIVDLQEPSAPRQLARVYVPDTAYGVVTNGEFAYVAAGFAGLVTIDVTQPMSASVVAELPEVGRARGVALHGTHAYVATYDRGLAVVDLTRPEAPVMVARVSDEDGIGSGRDVVTDGRAAYVAATETGIAVVDVRDPEAPRLLGVHDTAGVASSVALSADRLYVADEAGGILILERVVLPERPTAVPSCTAISPTPTTTESVTPPPTVGTPDDTRTPSAAPSPTATVTPWASAPAPTSTLAPGVQERLLLPVALALGEPGRVGAGVVLAWGQQTDR